MIVPPFSFTETLLNASVIPFTKMTPEKRLIKIFQKEFLREGIKKIEKKKKITSNGTEYPIR